MFRNPSNAPSIVDIDYFENGGFVRSEQFECEYPPVPSQFNNPYYGDATTGFVYVISAVEDGISGGLRYCEEALHPLPYFVTAF